MKDSDEYRRAEFRRLWLMGYARESFRNVRIACEHIVDQRLDEFSSINHPLCIAIVVLYARPFGRSKIVGALSDAFVPTEMRFLHEQLLAFRNEVAAHSDASGRLYGAGGPPANNVRVLNMANGQRSLAVIELKFSAAAIKEITALSNALIERTTDEVNSIWARLDNQGLIPTQPGEYIIDLTKGELVPTDPISGENIF
jgi:hypothetical protein